VVARASQGQFFNLIYARLKDVLEKDGLLPEAFVRFWQTVPLGQSE
jgi:hypothetical protein